MAVDNMSSANELSQLSQIERVVDTFIAPSKTFSDISRSISWWLPFLLSVLMSVATTVVIDHKVGFDVVVQNSIHDSPAQEEKIAQLTPEQRGTQMHGMTAGYRYVSYATPLLILLFSTIGALILWGSFNFGLGAQTTFGQMFAVWMFASLPRLLTGLLMIVTIFFGGNAESFNIKNPVGTNLAFYMADASPWEKGLLQFFDVIGLWNLLLLVIGTAIVAKVKRGQAAVVVVGWWLLIMIVSVGMTAAFS